MVSIFGISLEIKPTRSYRLLIKISSIPVFRHLTHNYLWNSLREVIIKLFTKLRKKFYNTIQLSSGKAYLRFIVKPHTSYIRMTYEYIRVKYDWHADDIWVHTSGIRMTYEYIRVTCGRHTSDIRMISGDIRVTYGWPTSTYEWYTDDIRVHTSGIRMTCEWHTDDMQFERKIK